ncbi:acyltransferase family protein [Cellulomonas aerilata]|uniref:Acyltransferase n=1 Tax=Cellulomonas aerilata TaxID=515326 RepID=A0A512DDF5_9CELL|nr:acyltransferase [Cellulomonas aerilata]GEO34514.1 acyltransferase [Cellulomonas aerilata]
MQQSGAKAKASPAKQGRVAALDGMRGIAALAVVGYHYLMHGPTMYPELGVPVHAALVGREGVRLFFIISGFVIALSLRGSTVSRFAVSRFIRLYPVYWLGLCGTFLVVALFGPPSMGVSWFDALANITMVQGFLGIPHVEGAYWTLGVELLFYITCAILWFGGALTPRRLPTTLYAWLGMTLVAVVVIPREQLEWSAVAQNLPWFMVGIVALAIYEGDRRPAVLLFPAAAIGTVALAQPKIAVFGALLFATVMLVLLWRPLGLTCRPLKFLGAISYPLYLLHQNIGYVLLLDLSSRGVYRPLAVLVTTTAMVALAALVTHVFDVPVRRALRRRLLAAPGRAASAETSAPEPGDDRRSGVLLAR